ncbi:MAG: arylsulfotransferase family protein [Geminicoccaceae bacterium]
MVDRLARLLFFAGIAVALVLGGVYLGWFRLPPVPQLDASVEALRDWRKHWKSYLGIEPTKFIRPAPTAGSGVTLHLDGDAQPGVTVMSGLWGGTDVGLALFSLDGRELHRWVARYSDLAPIIPPLPAELTPTNDWDTHADAMELFPDGDAIFNVGGLGMVRLDRCNRVVWWLDYETHHSIMRDDDGNLWAGGHKRARHTEADERFPGLAPPYVEDTLVKISPEDGRIVQEISLLEAIYRSSWETMLFSDGDDPAPVRNPDPLHLNHVEPLTGALAPAFPMFAAGDLLVSVRVPSTILVLDPRTGLIKWAQRGPWFGQHDPHFLPNGRISVYDNRDLVNHDAAARGVPARASRILQLDPATGRTETVFEGTLAEPFFTEAIGQHQYQPNGNILITESWGGRVFEITADGRKVWEFVNRIDPGRIALVEWSRRFPESYADFPKECPADAS